MFAVIDEHSHAQVDFHTVLAEKVIRSNNLNMNGMTPAIYVVNGLKHAKQHHYGPLKNRWSITKKRIMRPSTQSHRCMAVAQLLTLLRWLHTLSLCRPVKHALMRRGRRRGRRRRGLQGVRGEVRVAGEPTAKRFVEEEEEEDELTSRRQAELESPRSC